MVQTRSFPMVACDPTATLMASPPGGSDSTPRFLPLPAPRAANAAFLHAEIELLDVVLLQQPRAGIFHHDATDFQDVSVIGDVQRHIGVLLHQEHGHPPL